MSLEWSTPQSEDEIGRFSWCGFSVGSNILLPRLSRTDRKPKVKFIWRAGKVGALPPATFRHEFINAQGDTTWMAMGGDYELFRYEVWDSGVFCLRPGEDQIEFFDNGRPADPMRVEHALVNTVLGMFFNFQGALCLHAAAVARDGDGVVLAGPSGVGKSTLAWELVEQGWDFLSDDIAVITREKSGWVIHPGPCTIRLLDRSLTGSWNNRGKLESVMQTLDYPPKLKEIRLMTLDRVVPTQPQICRSISELQMAWTWADPATRKSLLMSVWDLLEEIPVVPVSR